jgi:hypothetical protein
MRIIIGCEMSGVVRDAFLARGHDAYSCDILDCERGPERHIKGDVLKILDQNWDLAIFHPPCTFLTNAGSKHLYRGGRKSNGRDEQRWADMRSAAEFFNALLAAPIPKIAIENPIMHRYARDIISRPYSQIVHPHWFGHAETKATCLWLNGLPLLVPTSPVAPDYAKYPPGRGNGFNPKCHYESPGVNRQRNRSRTLPGVAAALAQFFG